MVILCFGGFNGCTQGGADAAKWLKSTKIKIKNLLELLYGCIYSNSLVVHKIIRYLALLLHKFLSFNTCKKKLFCFDFDF
jgi:hypothetical protein